MHIAIANGSRQDRITATRADGSILTVRVPCKGPVPHDAVHFFVERELGLRRGFWGLVAAGHHPDKLVELAKAGGHASASRAGTPDAGIVELLQAERIVECYEALLWAGGGTREDVLAMAETGCASSHVACPVLAEPVHRAIADAVAAFAQAWVAAPEGHVAELVWQ